MEFIRNLDKNQYPLDGLVESIDNKSLEFHLAPGPINKICFVSWPDSQIGLACGPLCEYLIKNQFDQRIFERSEYIREGWHNQLTDSYGKYSYIWNLSSDFYEFILGPYLETYQEHGYEHQRFQAQVNPKELDPLFADFLIFLAIGEIKYGSKQLKVFRANRHLDFAKQIDSKKVNNLKQFGTGEIDPKWLEWKSDEVICKANDIYGTININVKNESEQAYEQALQFIINLLKTNQFPFSYQLKYTGQQKNELPIKALPKKPPHFFFANAIQYSNLHPLIEEYARLVIGQEAFYENLADENPAALGTFAVMALGLQDKKYLELVLSYMEQIDYEHQYVQDNFIPVLIEQYGINDLTHEITLNAVISADNFKYNKRLSELYQSPLGIEKIKATSLSEFDRDQLYRGLFNNKAPKELINL